MVRDYSRSIEVSTLQVGQLKTLNGERVYMLIENNTANPVFLNPDTPGNANDGIQIPANTRYERWKPFCPQNDFYLSGFAAALQRLQLTEGYEA